MRDNLLATPDRIDHILDTFPESFSRLSPEEQQVSLAIYRLLAGGIPASEEEIARATGVSREMVQDFLSRWCGVYLNDEGRVIGYWGLALPEMHHRFDVDGRTLYTWCAWDALFIPELIQKTALVTSKSPITGAEIHLRVSPERAESTDGTEVYVSFLEPCTEAFDQDVIGTFCHYVFFFASVEEGRQWTAKHPGTYLLTLEQAFALGKRKNAAQYGDLLHASQPVSLCDAPQGPACDLSALDDPEGHLRSASVLMADRKALRELADGYALQFPEAEIPRLFAFIEQERRCCPFLTFELVFEPYNGPLWLHIRSKEPVKALLAQELGIESPAGVHARTI